jgi:methylphosphotriester-DNA--protein-cysteine methyltransferase
MDEWKVPGLAIAVVQKRGWRWSGPMAFRDVEAGLLVATDTQFTICSITKSFTATGLALLTNERRMEAAYKALPNRDPRLGQIAARLGFFAPGHFMRFFSNDLGIPPSQYRRLLGRLGRCHV